LGKLEIVPDGSVTSRLIARVPEAWAAYVEHPFVGALANGTLPETAFRHYLVQDYIFLIHFSRAWALSAFKADSIEDIRQGAAVLSGLINDEIRLHVEYCAGYGLDEKAMAAAPEANANMAYTRFVMERGLAGDMLDLLVALAPCVVGYGEIGRRLKADPGTKMEGNPYVSWIEMYAGEEYGEVVTTAVRQLERVARERLGDDPSASPRWPSLLRDFEKACWLEADFWQMGWDAA
jgi:thiaminase/transcriptional activator TenA